MFFGSRQSQSRRKPFKHITQFEPAMSKDFMTDHDRIMSVGKSEPVPRGALTGKKKYAKGVWDLQTIVLHEELSKERTCLRGWPSGARLDPSVLCGNKHHVHG
eukprot:9729577-Heterocapsa_arctica.AAC.1